MTRLWGWRQPRRGLGLLLTDAGLALAQSESSVKAGDPRCAWHWHAWSAGPFSPNTNDWPDPGQLRKALARSGFHAQATALAVPDAQLQRFTVAVEPGLNTRQLQSAIGEQLSQRLTKPLEETVWDYQIDQDANAPAATTASAQPAWLQAAMQAQASQSAQVLVVARAWVQACDQWCRAAGLQVVRLEPPWQASSRWQAFTQLHPQASQDLLSQGITRQQQAVLGGLALGVVMP
jgi:hypothetical protein